MVQEAYCSTETSKRLVAAGYHGDNINGLYMPGDDADINEYYISLSCAMRWLREEKDIYLNIRVNPAYELTPGLDLNFVVDILDNKHDRWISTDNEIVEDSYEAAVEAAVKYTLDNLLT